MGSYCSELGRPCKTDDDCQGATSCFDVQKYFNIADEDAINAVFDFLQVIDFFPSVSGDIKTNLTFLAQSALVYGENEQQPGCFQAQRGAGTRNPENDIIANLLSYVANNYYSAQGNFEHLSFCGISELIELGESGIFHNFFFNKKTIPAHAPPTAVDYGFFWSTYPLLIKFLLHPLPQLKVEEGYHPM